MSTPHSSRPIETHYYRGALTGKPDRVARSATTLNATVAATRRLLLKEYRVAYIRLAGTPLVKLVASPGGVKIAYGEGHAAVIGEST